MGSGKVVIRVAGYVPSLKSDGFVRAGSDQVLAQADAEDRAAKRSNEQRDEAVTGSPRTKAEKIERNAQFRLGTEKVAKDGNDHEKHLDFTETTLKFGLFCITLMFFRAMSFVRRERDTFAGTHDAITSTGNPQKPTEERRKMRREKALLEERQKKMQHVLNRAKVGEERTRKRLAKERAEAASKLHEKVRREKRELQACAKLQAFYRGHLGRKAARQMGGQTSGTGGHERVDDGVGDYDRARLPGLHGPHCCFRGAHGDGRVHLHD